jgi:hypothetical protein
VREFWLSPARNAPTAKRGRSFAASSDKKDYVFASPSSLRSSDIIRLIKRRFYASHFLNRRAVDGKTPTAKTESCAIRVFSPSAFLCCSYRAVRARNLARRRRF